MSVCPLLIPGVPAKNAPPRSKTIEVRHFAVAAGVPVSQDFASYFQGGLPAVLPRLRPAARAVEDGAAVPESEAADSPRIPSKSSPLNKGENVGGFTGSRASFEIKRAPR